MLWLKSLHLIFMVTWFSGIFYLPRLYVYHAMSTDQISLKRFKIMEYKLLFWITTPSALLATLFGLWLLFQNLSFYLNQTWMIIKLILVAFLWLYHIACIRYYLAFKNETNLRSAFFFRWFNEIPAFLLVSIIILAVVKP